MVLCPHVNRMNLPQEFITTIQNTFGDEGKAWLASLPDLLDEATRRWHLTDIQSVSNLSYNFVAFANRSSTAVSIHRTSTDYSTSPQGDEVVLKIGVPNRELISEMNALRFFDGKGAVRLLETDEERFMFLLERLQPGNMLTTLDDDDRAMNIAADVMLKLWRPAPTEGAFIQLSDWFKGFGKLRVRFEGGTGPLE